MKVSPWLFILIGGMFETVWAVSMKLSEGFSNISWTIITMAFIVVSVFFLNSGLKRGLPVGGGYAVWVGMGAIGSIIVGIILFSESLDPMRLLFAGIIITGIIGTELTCHPEKDDPEEEDQTTSNGVI